MTYGLAVLGLLGFGGIGVSILFSGQDLNMSQTIGASAFIMIGAGIFALIFYLNISSMGYYYENAVIKKYGRYGNAPVDDVTYEINDTDEVICCFISVRHIGKTLNDLFELPLEKEYLLPVLEEIREVPVRVVEGMPSLLRIAPKKLLWELEKRRHNAPNPA